MTETSTLAENISSLRKAKGLNQSELAEKLGISRAAVSLYEKGKSNPAYKILTRLAEALDTTVDALMGRGSAQSNAGIIGTESTLEHIELPFIRPAAYATFSINCQDIALHEFETISILRIEGLNYRNAVVIEVRGNSMADRYPDRSRYVVRPVSDGNWQYAMGVHAIALRNEMFLIKRIISNKEGLVVLSSDSTKETMEITLGDINCMWKVGEAAYMPAED